MPDDEERWADLSPPTRRKRWPYVVALALFLVGPGVVLTVYLGNRYGANLGFGEKVDAGRSGSEIWLKNCAACHGIHGEGTSAERAAPAFTPDGPLANMSLEDRIAKITRGKPLRGMPAWRGKLTPEQIRMVAEYTLILSGQQPEPTPSGAS